MILESFIREIDARWSRASTNKPITLQVIGSTALMLILDMRLGTTDSDIIETAELDEAVKLRLLEIAGPGSECERQFGLHLHFVAPGLPLLPQAPRYREIERLHDLKRLRIRALDPVDVAVSKLKLLRPNDKNDISALIQNGHITHADLLVRFTSALDIASMGARAEDIPRFIKNFHEIERDEFGLPPTKVKLPDHLD